MGRRRRRKHHTGDSHGNGYRRHGKKHRDQFFRPPLTVRHGIMQEGPTFISSRSSNTARSCKTPAKRPTGRNRVRLNTPTVDGRANHEAPPTNAGGRRSGDKLLTFSKTSSRHGASNAPLDSNDEVQQIPKSDDGRTKKSGPGQPSHGSAEKPLPTDGCPCTVVGHSHRLVPVAAQTVLSGIFFHPVVEPDSNLSICTTSTDGKPDTRHRPCCSQSVHRQVMPHTEGPMAIS